MTERDLFEEVCRFGFRGEGDSDHAVLRIDIGRIHQLDTPGFERKGDVVRAELTSEGKVWKKVRS